MMRSQKQLTILVILVGVMIAVYAKAFRPSAPPSGPPDVPLSTSPNEGQAGAAQTERSWSEQSTQRDAQRERATRLAWRRDPFTRGAAMDPMSGLQLSGILWDAHAPIAIINNQMVQVGEDLQGYQIVEISSDRVSLTDGTETIHLTISP